MLDSYASNWVISSEILTQEAIKKGFDVTIIDESKNFYSISNEKKKVYFKSNDCGIDSSIGIKIADDKELSYIVAEENNIKIPKTQYVLRNHVQNLNASDIEISYPVITKPVNGAHGDGVVIGINDFGELQEALNFSFENKSTQKVIIQEFIQGDDYRIIIVGGTFVAAAKRVPPHIIGNGKNTIIELIREENGKRGCGDHDSPTSQIKVDSELEDTIYKQGYTKDDILENGKKIQLRKNANLSTGGTSIDVTKDIHPKIITEAINYVNILGLGLAGVDIMTTDITKPLEETNGAIIEINNTPGLRMHHFPSEGDSVNVAGKILDFVFT